MKARIALALIVAPVAAHAEQPVIHVWGTPALLGVAERWAEAWQKQHPEAQFEFRMRGSDSAIHGLVSGAADIALMGRLNDVVDDNGFSRPKNYPVTRIEIATGAVSSPGKSDAIAVLVNPGNPLPSISLQQLGRILDCGDQPHPIRNWGQLGLKGAWAEAPIHVHTYDFASRTGAWIQSKVSANDRRMCWERIAEYTDRRRLDGTIAKAADNIGEAAVQDRYAIAIANPAQVARGLKLLAISDGGNPAVLPKASTLISRSYPLARPVYAFVDRPPGKSVAPHILNFLQFVLSKAGQDLLSLDKGYLPLEPTYAAAQAAILENRR